MPAQSALSASPSWLDVLAGTGAQAQAAQQTDALAGRRLQLSELFGGIDPSMLGLDGGGGYLNTLSRDQLNAAMDEAKRGYSLDVARFGLAQADLNYRQRATDAQNRLQEMALQVSQRGPANAIGYNYLLGNRAAPGGTEKPLNTPSVSQQSNIQVPPEQAPVAARTAGGGVAPPPTMPPPAAAPAAPAAPPAPAPTALTGAALADAQWSALQAAGYTGDRRMTGLAKGGIVIPQDSQPMMDGEGATPAEHASDPSWLEGYAAGMRAEMMQGGGMGGEQMQGGGAGGFLDTLAQGGAPSSVQPMQPMQGMARGGEVKSRKQVGYLLSSGSPLTSGQQSKLKGELHSGAVKVKHRGGGGVARGVAMTGDKHLMETGRRSGDEELVMPTMRGGRPAAIIMPIPEGAPMPPVKHAAAGGVINTDLTGGTANTYYSQEDIANTPAVRQATGAEPTPRFGAFAGNTTIPGTETSIPFGAQQNYTALQDMQPSSRALLESIVSTPQDQGGLGLEWADFLESSRRGAPLGRRYATAGYGA